MGEYPELAVLPRSGRTWFDAGEGGFPASCLPLGVADFGTGPRIVTRVGAHLVDLAAVAEAGSFDGIHPDLTAALTESRLNSLLSLGRSVWNPFRLRLFECLTEPTRAAKRDLENAIHPAQRAHHLIPVEVRDFVDFNSSMAHAESMGRLFRPGQSSLPRNWRHVPVAYHGRAGTIVASGTDISRPYGQVATCPQGRPTYRLSEALDVEIELGFITGATRQGERIPADDALRHVFGLVLVNDWSARDIQAWEAGPLGPFASKSFATSISPWVIPIDALVENFVVTPEQDPEPLPHLQATRPYGLDLDLQLAIGRGTTSLVAEVNARELYWSFAQQFAHLTANGCRVSAGDLFATGTVSQAARGRAGSLMELSEGGSKSVQLADGCCRRFLRDDDTVTLRGTARQPDGSCISLGEVSATIRAGERRVETDWSIGARASGVTPGPQTVEGVVP
jgi:fumarylacetoacetase